MFEVEPVPGHEAEILKEFTDLPLKCADGLEAMLDILAEQEPSPRDRCGLLADRHEIFAVPLPDCAMRRLVLSIDCKAKGRPRAVHGTLPSSPHSCENGRLLATRQLALTGPAWEPQR